MLTLKRTHFSVSLVSWLWLPVQLLLSIGIVIPQWEPFSLRLHRPEMAGLTSLANTECSGNDNKCDHHRGSGEDRSLQ